MSQQEPATSGESLARFDAARDRFLDAFTLVPDEVLPFVPVGDEYALGTLLPHLCDPIARYLRVFDKIEAAGYADVDLNSDPAWFPAEVQRHRDLVAMQPTGADRAGMLADLAAAHSRVHARFASLDPTTFVRQAGVIYSPGTALYPTSARDIMGWLIDHYDEHTAQVAKMLTEWNARS
jgi:hypothetical protein